MLSEVELPQEYAQGLQDLLVKEQQDDQMSVDTEIQQKQVRIAELQAEAEAAQKVKQAEGDAKSKVVEAKGEADAMQYTLPLKQKQIEQSKLEAEARKEATIQNAEADAQAKVIDSKAELERRNLMADAEANRIKVVAAANAERMTSEAALLNKSPLLITKIVAERLSDKIQVVMALFDGKGFFASDVFKKIWRALRPANRRWIRSPSRRRRVEATRLCGARDDLAPFLVRWCARVGRRLERYNPRNERRNDGGHEADWRSSGG